MRGATLLAVALISLVASGCGPSGEHEARGHVAIHCPRRGHATNLNPAARHILVPPNPISVTICRYYGSNALHNGPFAGRLTVPAQRTIADSRAVAFARSFDRLSRLPMHQTFALACPAASGPLFVAIFAYADQPPDPVTIEGGCIIASNGRLRQGVWVTTGLLRQLRAAAPLSSLRPARR